MRSVPVLANITEFGATPLFTLDELRSAGVAVALYPLSAFRATNKRRSRLPARRRARKVRRRRHAARGLYDYPATAAADRAVRGGGRPGRRRSDQDRTRRGRSRSPCRASPPATRRLVRSAVPQRPGLPRLRHPRSRADETPGTAYLLIHGKLPTSPAPRTRPAQELAACRAAEILQRVPAAAHPMDVMRTGTRRSDGAARADDHAAPAPRHRRSARRFVRVDAPLLVPLGQRGSRSRPTTIRSAVTSSISRHGPEAAVGHAMHASLILYAEHGFNASTFTARVIAGTGADITGDHRRDRCVARAEARRRQRVLLRDPEALRLTRRGRGGHPPARRGQGGHHRLRPPRLHDRRPAQRGDQGSGARAVAGRGQHEDVRHRHADRGGDGRDEEDVRESRLVFGRQLSHDGRADGDVHTFVRDLAHDRLGGARDRAAAGR